MLDVETSVVMFCSSARANLKLLVAISYLATRIAVAVHFKYIYTRIVVDSLFSLVGLAVISWPCMKEEKKLLNVENLHYIGMF